MNPYLNKENKMTITKFMLTVAVAGALTVAYFVHSVLTTAMSNLPF